MIGLIGNGSWATAIAKIITDNGQCIHWWMRNESAVESLSNHQHNFPYLSSISFDKNFIIPTNNLEVVINNCDQLILCVPSAYLESLLNDLDIKTLNNKLIISAVKGILPESQSLLNDYLQNKYNFPIENYVALTGPCHAEEIAMERLSYLTFSCINLDKAELISKLFKNNYVQTITNKDIYGTQYAAVLKNIYAIGAGMLLGLGYRDNFLSVWVTNCFNEMCNFINPMMDSENVPITSAYLGDLLVTCYSLHSRNRRFGMLLGQGYSIPAAISEMGMMAEGYMASKGMNSIIQKQEIELPILSTIYNILWTGSFPNNEFKKIETILV